MTALFSLTDIQLWLIVLGFLSPVVVSLVSRPTFNPYLKILIQVLFCLVVAFITLYLYGQLEGRSIVSTIIILLAASVVAYKGFWKPTGLAESIEAAVNGGDPVHPELPAAEDVEPQDVYPDDSLDSETDPATVETAGDAGASGS